MYGVKLFRTNPETKLPEFTEEARVLEPFKQLIKRISKMEGDTDGRKKLLNEKEMAYVCFSAKPDATLRYVTTYQDKVDLLKMRLGLPKDWKEDELVKECITTLKESTWSESIELVDLAIKSALGIKSFLADILKNVETNPGKFKIKDISELQVVYKNLPEMIDNIRIAKEKLEAEQESMITKSGRMISKFETE